MSISNELAPYTASNNGIPPRKLGQRYDTKRFLPEAGNTIVCHLDFNAPAHSAVLEARRRLKSLPGAERFLYTPVSSLHMTVFEGVIETRRTRDAWPSDIAQTASIESVTKSMVIRLADFLPPPGFAVRVAGLRPSGLIFKGATQDDEANMRAWRDALTAPFGYRHNEHDAYRYHMTFSYPTDWLPASHLSIWESEFRSILTDLVKAAPVIPLTPPAFCSFADMTRFEELLILKD